MRAGRSQYLYLILLGLINLTGGCELFRTRPTEPPLNGGTPWIAPNAPDDVFSNLELAMTELNAQNYLRCFFSPDDGDLSFLFVPNQSSSAWPVGLSWGYPEESEAIQNLFNQITPGTLPFLNFNKITELPYGNQDSVYVAQEYLFQTVTSNPTLPQEISGRSDFFLARTTTGYWAIYRWEDIEGLPSWTELRAGLQ